MQIDADMERRLLAVADETLSTIFSGSGKQALLYYLRVRHGVGVSDLVRKPAVFESALSEVLGEAGSKIVVQIAHLRMQQLS